MQELYQAFRKEHGDKPITREAVNAFMMTRTTAGHALTVYAAFRKELGEAGKHMTEQELRREVDAFLKAQGRTLADIKLQTWRLIINKNYLARARRARADKPRMGALWWHPSKGTQRAS